MDKRREIEGYIECKYSKAMFSNEREVSFPAISGPRADGFAPHYDKSSRMANLNSSTDYLLRKIDNEYTQMVGNNDGESGEGLLKVLQTDTQDNKSMIHVRCSWTGMLYTFVIESKKFSSIVRLRSTKVIRV